jgi:hypothetical protein
MHHSSYHHRINSFNKDSPDSVFQLQRAIGNQVVQRIVRSNNTIGFNFAKIGILQPKLIVSQPGDEYEQEADRVAEQIMTKSVDNSIKPAMANKGDEERIDRKCAACEMGKKEEGEEGVVGGGVEEEGEEEGEEEEYLNISRNPSRPMSRLEATDETANEISNVMSSSGSPLDSSSRQFMESRFADYDFSNVRVHTDLRAAESAQALNANAYTIKNNIVFGEGQYKPNTSEGRKLIAHELVHTIQQGEGRNNLISSRIDNQLNQTAANPHGPRKNNSSIEKRNQHLISLAQRWPWGIMRQPAAPSQAPAVCSPNTPLTWANFQGRGGRGRFGAMTSFRIRELRIGRTRIFQAQFNRSASWVQPKFRNPRNRARNGCATSVARCTTSMRRNPGSTWGLLPPPPGACPAAIGPNAVTASSIGDCQSIVGTECDRAAVLESDRLLRHEQFHFNIACELANKATAALSAGDPIDRIRRGVRAKSASLNDSYDRTTNHGCRQAAQSHWEGIISAGLPNIFIP